MIDQIPLRRALISVSDKTGLLDLAYALVDQGVELVSTGGSAKAIRDAGLDVLDVATITGFPEMMDGRVKTLHPNVHGGLLALRNNLSHVEAMEKHGITGIDLLIVNLYPFEETVASGANYKTAIENIDIGGPAMIRAAAKNHGFVSVVVDVEDYQALLKQMDANDGATPLNFRQKLAQNAYALTGAYDAAVSTWMAREIGESAPRRRVIAGTFVQEMRYGENPHQKAAFYTEPNPPKGTLSTFKQIQGKELSFNNLNDANNAWECVKSFSEPTCVIVKHANPCGVSSAKTILEAYRHAYSTDSTSAFGGIIAINQEMDNGTAELISKQFVEVLIAPSFSLQAKKIFEKLKIQTLMYRHTYTN